MTPQNYYARRKARGQRVVDVDLVLELVREVRREQPSLGGRKVYHLIEPELKKAGVKIGRDRLFAELNTAGLLVEKRRSAWPKTTRFDPTLPVFRNRIKNRKLTGPNQAWAADITYLRTEEGFLYLALIIDLWSRKIVGFELGKTLEARISLQALNMAIATLKKNEKPIHHSDRGCQYASHAFVKRLKQAGLPMSMTEKDHCAENAVAERLNGILKQEYWLDVTFKNYKEAKRACEHSIRVYNTKRPHSELEMMTPEQVHNA